jgi:uncharacterized protein YecT (DUF1311 family)
MGWTEPMRRVRVRRPGPRRHRSRVLARVAVLTAVAGLLAACGSSGSASSSATSAAAAAQAAGSASAAAAPFVDIIEPFDPGHPAITGTAPANCGSQAATLAIEQCYEVKTENVDVAIDAAQLARYQSASPAGKTAILNQDSAWLAARQPVCAVAFNTGGTIDGINTASCLLDESTARLDAIKGIIPPEAKLKGTDSLDPNQLSWYTTPEGSRIAQISTQGDTTGGALVSWVIIGGPDGFVVNPKQFYFADKSFTVAGKFLRPNPTYHRVTVGQEYQFGMDYPHLEADPNANKSAAGYCYAPGAPVAVWGG